MATTGDDPLRQFCRALGTLRETAGVSYRALEDHPQAPRGRAAINAILTGNITRPPDRSVVKWLIEAIHDLADEPSALPPQDDLLEQYDQLVAPLTPVMADIVIRVDSRRTTIQTRGSAPVAQPHDGIGTRLPILLEELERRRRRTERIEDRPFVPPASGDKGPVGAWSGRVGPEIGRRFLGGAVGRSLQVALASDRRIRIALSVTDPDLAALPWESAVVPGTTGPWCRHDNVQFYRLAGTDETEAEEPAIPGPLRILAMIARPPLRSGLSGLHEQGLAAVDESVNAARRERLAIIDEPVWSDPASLRAQLSASRYHVLYLTCPADRDGLLFETVDGQQQSVAPGRLADDILGAAPPVPFVILRTFATEPGKQVWPMVHELVRRLCAANTCGVLVIPASMTHHEAVRFTSAMFTFAAYYPARTIIDVVSRARRRERDDPYGEPRLFLTHSGVDRVVVGLDERSPDRPTSTPLSGLPTRRASDFVGRRRELQTILAAVQGPGSGVVITGIGGIGKSTLAVQAVRILGPAKAGVVVVAQGATSVEEILAALAARLRSWDMAGRAPTTVTERLLTHLGNTRLVWTERLRLLAEHVLPTTPVTLLLDGFEENLAAGVPGGELNAFLGEWVRLSESARLLITSRYEVLVPEDARPWVTTLSLGPLTLAEARRLAWRLPALDALDDDELRSAIATVGGHPRTLEYFDALLRGGRPRFLDIQARLRRVLTEDLRLRDPERWLARGFSDPGHTLTESIAVTAGEVLLSSLVDQLGDGSAARELLLRAAVFRQPIDDEGLLGLIGTDAVRARATLTNLGLLAEVPVEDGQPEGRRWLVHRWTAGTLARHTDPGVLRDAHDRAAAYWLSRVDRDGPPTSPEATTRLAVAQLEAAHHLLAAGREREAAWAIDLACGQLDVRGGFSWILQVCREAAGRLRAHGDAEAVVLSREGVSAARLALYEEATGCLTDALAVRLGQNLTEGLSANLANLATMHQLFGDYPAALDRYRQALQAYGPGDDDTAMATVNYNLGNLARRRGDLDIARRFYTRGLLANEPSDDETTTRLRDDTLADLAALAAPPPINPDAPAEGLPAWDLGRVERATRGPGRPARNLILRHRGEYPAAEQRTVASPYDTPIRAVSIGSGHCNLGVVAQTAGDYDVAAEHYARAHSIFTSLHDQGRLPIVVHNEATLAQLSGDVATAHARYHQALTLFTELNDVAGFSTGYHNIGALVHSEGDYGLARDFYRLADEAYEKLRDPIGRAGIAANLGVLHAARGDRAAANESCLRAWRVFAHAADVLSCAAVASTLGLLRLDAGTAVDGVPWSLRALLTRSRHGLGEAAVDADALARQRAAIGRRGFTRLLGLHLPERAAGELDDLIAEWNV
ncbi:tetratricopeptide repeat protein [Micromonospora sp. MH99]|uniref:tetratricopeptide repeat protein n=1 Tax=Micromonospora sp. MH99 TaxID=1945510 RepID=UPI001F1C17AF|nr:tetratricopeptide repeat protein [Micromonospora sp. MH99]MCF0091699.1 Photosystem I assembly protein Ycf3 [Micromonospora sp. MH99]